MSDVDEKFWLESPCSLLSDYNLIPSTDDSLAKRMNAITRLIIVVFIIIVLVKSFTNKSEIPITFLGISLLFIIIFYYTNGQRKEMNNTKNKNTELREPYTSVSYPYLTPSIGNNVTSQPRFGEVMVHKLPHGQNRKDKGSLWQIKQAPLIPLVSSTGPIDSNTGQLRNPTYQQTRRLDPGPPNPKMNKPPVMVPRGYSDVWAAPYHVNSHINETRVRFLPNDPSDYDSDATKHRIFGDQNPTDRHTVNNPYGDQYDDYNKKYEQITSQSGMDDEDLVENYSDFKNQEEQEQKSKLRNTSLPSTLSVENDDRYDYTDNLVTRVSTTDTRRMLEHEIIEDINSGNMGVSYQPQHYYTNNLIGPSNVSSYSHTMLNPQSVRDENSLSPNRVEEMPLRNEWSTKSSPYEAQPGSYRPESIYDPRWTGAGDSRRAYEDITTGQIRYYHRNLEPFRYGDLFNTLTKNNIDHVDAYTPTGEVWYTPKLTNDFGEDYRQQGLNQYDSDVLTNRQSLMESLMSKQNRREWARRVAPMNAAVNYR